MIAIRSSSWTVLCAATFLLEVASGWRHLAMMSQRHEAALASLVQLERDSEELIRLRSQREAVAWRQRPTADVLAQVNEALIESGIPTAQLVGVGEAGDAPVAAGSSKSFPLRRQSMTITLQSLTPIQIGTFLHQWIVLQDQWSSRRLDLIHRPNGRHRELYDLRLYISADYVAAN